MNRKHEKIPQFDGHNEEDDPEYDNSAHYWKTNYLGSAYQAFIDANSVIENSSLEENQKIDIKEAILESRKTALGQNFRFYPPWE